VYKIAAISPTILTILMHLMMEKQAETCCATDVLNKHIQLEKTVSFKISTFEF
jgi:hypothetical protein